MKGPYIDRRSRTKYDLQFHLKKIGDTRVRRLYRDIHRHALTMSRGIEVKFCHEYTQLWIGGRWFARLFAQKTKMGIEVKGEYSAYPTFRTIKPGSPYSDGVRMNFHLYADSSLDEAKLLLRAAYKREIGQSIKHQSQGRTSGTSASRVVFFYIGWMKYYEGLPPQRCDGIVGGGEFVEKNGFGFEIFNFREYEQRLYGYVQPVTQNQAYANGTIRVERLGAARSAVKVEGVTVVFVAKSPESLKRHIVGWYEDATVFRKRQPPPKGSKRTYKGQSMGYFASAACGNHVLIEESLRDDFSIEVPVTNSVKKSGMGRSHVWYADKPKDRAFVVSVLRFIAQWGPAEDADESAYQTTIHLPGKESWPLGPIPPPKRRNVSHNQWPRNPEYGRAALRRSNYKCIINSRHKTFLSASNSRNYVEAHHLVPMSQQDKFAAVSLDAPGNIVALCPTCHRLLHFGKSTDKAIMLKKLYKARLNALKKYKINLSLQEFLRAYDV